MALHPKFPDSPYAVVEPGFRWFPADETLRDSSYEKLLPPLVHKLRIKVKDWRDRFYAGASPTSLALLKWWFIEQHTIHNIDRTTQQFRYYFAQQEAIETIIYLHDISNVQGKYDLLRYDSSNAVSPGMFDEDWRRFVIKMATGSGKTKVMSLILAWCYYHKLYEPNSDLARNFLLISPNIIVLDRLLADFNNLRVFYEDPVIPDNGYEGRNWRDDFQLKLHVQDEVQVTQATGNIFLTNIHRVYSGDNIVPSTNDDNTTDYFLGQRPTGGTTDSKVDLGDIVRNIDELVIINDEAHHIHDPKLAWFKAIQDIHNRLLHKDKELSMQIDMTATPKHNNGAIFVQTVSDYPLVEAVHQNVVKHPVLPDESSRGKLREQQSSKFTEKYADYINLGIVEWRKTYKQHKKLNKKAILFVMTDDTRNCDEVAKYLIDRYEDFTEESILVIHTKNNGEISEATTGKKAEELKLLRKQANRIDNVNSPYKAIVSVLMLKEGWDVRNVTTIVGLRAYAAKSNILPEQTLGRGLRRMYPNEDATEYVSVVGTEAFMDFVESIQSEGIELDRKKMGEGTDPKVPLIIEIDNDNKSKNLDNLDIYIPKLTPRIYREYKNLSNLDPQNFKHKKIKYKHHSKDETREIVFRDISTEKITHKTLLISGGDSNYQNVIGYFTQTIMRDLRLISSYEILYGHVKHFIANCLFTDIVPVEDPITIINLAEIEARRTIIETFKQEINKLTIKYNNNTEIRDHIKLCKVRPFVVKEQGYFIPQKSVFNKIVGDSHLELQFASFLDRCDDIVSYAKNYFAVNFKLDYINANGEIANYYPDFIVKKSTKEIYIVETKGLADLDVPHKIERLKQWCDDATNLQNTIKYNFVYVDEESFKKYSPTSFEELISNFTNYKLCN